MVIIYWPLPTWSTSQVGARPGSKTDSEINKKGHFVVTLKAALIFQNLSILLLS